MLQCSQGTLDLSAPGSMAICDIMKMFKSGEPNSPMILASASSFAACQDKEKDRKKETENGKEKAKDKEKEVLKDKAKDKEKGKEKAAKEKARSVLLFASSCMF